MDINIVVVLNPRKEDISEDVNEDASEDANEELSKDLNDSFSKEIKEEIDEDARFEVDENFNNYVNNIVMMIFFKKFLRLENPLQKEKKGI